jgi:uncharacterized membrane protein
MLMHTLGGVFIAIVLGAIFYKRLVNSNKKKIFIFLICSVLIIGILWEGYEYIVQYFIKNVHLADIPDSISDLVCDVVGGVLGTIFVVISKKSYNNTDAR